MNHQSTAWAVLLVLSLATGCGAAAGTNNPTQRPSDTAPAQTPSNPQQVCADAVGRARAWQDLNANGVWDAGEPPLAGVAITLDNPWTPGGSGMTGVDGQWQTGPQIGSCGSLEQAQAAVEARCKSVEISAIAPSGYEPTTQTEVNGCEAEFGFVRVSP